MALPKELLQKGINQAKLFGKTVKAGARAAVPFGGNTKPQLKQPRGPFGKGALKKAELQEREEGEL
jgi:hypothetical protein